MPAEGSETTNTWGWLAFPEDETDFHFEPNREDWDAAGDNSKLLRFPGGTKLISPPG